MIDLETGYDDSPFCGCKPCKKCEGEGSIVTKWAYFDGDGTLGPNCATKYALETETCPECKGKGTTSEYCEIEIHWSLEDQRELAALEAEAA